MTASWSDLSSDLLLLISEALTIADFTSFSSVCRSWRSLASSVKGNRRCRRQEPLLMFVGGEDSSSVSLYSISDQKIFTIPNQPNPSIANRMCLGSANGWLITADERSELSLLNPITRQQFDLPPVSTFDHVIPLRRDPDGRITHYRLKSDPHGWITPNGLKSDPDGWITHYGLESDPDGWIPGLKRRRVIRRYSAESLRHRLYFKAVLSSSPCIDDDYMVVLLLRHPESLSFARSGDKKWTTIGPEGFRNDIMYHKNDGKVYTILWSGEVESWDFSQKDGSMPEPTVLVPKPEFKVPMLFHSFYLVHASWGELLLVRTRDDLRTRRIEVYKVDCDTRKIVRVESLGDYALFLGGNHPICISSKEVPGVKANCVYFNAEFSENTRPLRDYRRDTGIFNLEDASFEPILLEDPRLNWPPPFWLTPSLA